MWTILVVVAAPGAARATNLFEGREPSSVEQLLTNAPVERFDKGVVRRLPRARVVDDDVVGVRPLVECRCRKFGSVVAPDRLWAAAASRDDFVQYRDDVDRTEGERRFKRETLTGMDVDNRQQTIRSARFIRKTVVHEVKAPNLVRRRDDGARLTNVRALSALVRFFAQAQPFDTVQPSHALDVYGPALSPQ